MSLVIDPRGLLLLGAGLLLGACAARAPLPARPPTLDLPQQLHVQQIRGDTQTDWLLVIQQDAGALRFSLLDPLGVPLARQRLLQGAWQNDGLLPPNPQARELFAALLFALTPPVQLLHSYPGSEAAGPEGGRSLRQRGEPRWQVRSTDNGLLIELANGTHYRIEPLAEALE